MQRTHGQIAAMLAIYDTEILHSADIHADIQCPVSQPIDNISF